MGGRATLRHQGSNTMNVCLVRLALLRDFAVLAVTNQGGDEADKAANEVTDALIRMRHTQ
jgi:hypothetical protein